MSERKTLAQRLAERRASQSTTAINGYATYDAVLADSRGSNTNLDRNHNQKDKNLLVHLPVLTENNSDLPSRDDILSNNDDAFMDNLQQVEKFAEEIKETNLTDELDTTSTDPLSIYLQEIGRFPLLTHKQEIELAQRKERGDEEARSKLIQHNLRLVVAVAKKHADSGELSLSDLIQEGNMGLMRAVDKYDWMKGYRFSTYAIWWIRQSITKAIADKGSSIRVPAYLRTEVKRKNSVEEKLKLQLGRTPTQDEIVEEMSIQRERFDNISRAGGVRQITSLSTIVTEEGRELQEFIPSDDISIEELGEASEDFNKFLKAWEQLPERERDILLQRRIKGKKLSEVGEKYSLSRERIRQLEKKAFQKLKDLLSDVDPDFLTLEENGVFDLENSLEESRKNEEGRTNFQFSDRHLKILKLLAEGLNRKEIGKQLGISLYLLGKQISEMLKAVGAKNRLELLRITYQNGILPLEEERELREGEEVVIDNSQMKSKLTQRDKELLIAIFKGKSDSDIGAERGLSTSRVKNKVALLCDRYGVRNRSQLLSLLLQKKVINLEDLS